MDKFGTLYEKWRKSFIQIAFFISSVNLVIEIVMSHLLMVKYPGMIKLDSVPYLLLYIVLPSSLNFAICIFGKLKVESDHISEQSKNYISVLTLTGICFVMSSAHNVYAVLSCSLCFPVYITIMFSDKKMTRNITVISFFLICISTYFGSIDGRADDKLLYVDLFITLDLLISSYFIARYLFRLEYEKNMLIKESFIKQSQLEEQLKYDPLTNLYNMSTFFNLLSMAIEKEQFPLAVAVIDIDNFKRVNDTWGHDNGNIVLIYLSQLLRAHCSAMGQVCRYGGEEFSIIFPNKSSSEAKFLVEDIQRIFETHQFEFFENGSITFSCGIAETSQSECKPRDLFHIADQAMYQAKSTGKNKTVIYGDGM